MHQQVQLKQVVSRIASIAAEAAAATLEKTMAANSDDEPMSQTLSSSKTVTSTATMSSSWQPITKIKLMQTFQQGSISLHHMLHVLYECHPHHTVEHSTWVEHARVTAFLNLMNTGMS